LRNVESELTDPVADPEPEEKLRAVEA
jgi:hypothetical protein